MLRRSLTIATVLLTASPALAQDPAPAPPPPPAALEPPMDPAPAPMMMEGAAAAPAAEAPAGGSPPVSLTLFADSYYSYNTNPRENDPMHQPFHRAFARNNGFSLSFLGIDATWDNGTVGATASLRFGPSVPIFYGADLGALGIDNILQAFATWHVNEALALDFGQFGTIYGAEVAESWLNLNYTRGALYYAMQPFWHTGLRATLTVNDSLVLKGLVVNGVNNLIDSGKSLPSLGAQAVYTGGPLSVILGYLGSTDPQEDAPFDHFVDLVANLSLGDFNLLLNADFGMDTETGGDNTTFFGVSLAAGYRFTEQFGIAVRGEHIIDNDNAFYEVMGATKTSVTTGTLTFDYRPVPNIILRWDNRVERSDQDIYLTRKAGGSGMWFQSVLGFVVTSSI
jgi:hypothetical protein